MPKPEISVIMAVRNGSDYLRASIESILNQTLTRFEFLIMDDGSTDETLRILNEYKEKDARIVVLSRSKRGLTTSLIELAALARGTYIARQDADDISMPERFARQHHYMENNPSVGLVGAYAFKIDSAGKTLERLGHVDSAASVKNFYKNHNLFVHGALMFRKQAYDAVGGYRSGFIYSQDYDLSSRIVENMGGANIPQPLYQLRTHDRAISHRKELVQLHLAALVSVFNHERNTYGTDSYKSEMPLDSFPAYLQHKKFLFRYYLYRSNYYISRRQWSKALAAFIRSIPRGVITLDFYAYQFRRIICNAGIIKPSKR